MTLRIPASVYTLVSEQAKLDRRSFTGELLHMVESGLSRPRIAKLITKVDLPVSEEGFITHHIRIPPYLYVRLTDIRDLTGLSLKDLFTAMVLLYCEESNIQFKQAIARTLQNRLPEDVFDALVQDADAASVPVVEKVIHVLIDLYGKQ